MKKYLFLISILLIVSCSIEQNQSTNTNTLQEKEDVSVLTTKAGSHGDNNQYAVSEKDIYDYIRFRKLESKQDRKVKEITPQYGENGNTLAYIVNYETGWEVVSADKRTAPRLAHSDSGSFDMNSCPVTQREWLSSVMNEVAFLQNLSSEQRAKLEAEYSSEMMANYTFWGALTASEDVVLKEEYRAKHPPLLGYFELDGVVVDTLEYETINHLMGVHWNQGSPFNNYCPLRTDIPTLRAPAGCGAIASAQILWYLHTTYGFPVYSPDYAECIGNVDSFTMNHSGQSSSIWADMPSNGDKAAILISKIGSMVGMQYSNTSSSSSFYYYRLSVFAPFGVSCDYYPTFDESVAKNNLLCGYPIYTAAYTASGAGHGFVIDGYKSVLLEHKYHYIWVSTDPSPDPQTIIIPDYYETYQITGPEINEYTMNWGWGEYYDNGWYSVTGSWTSGGHAFNSGKSMIVNFSVID